MTAHTLIARLTPPALAADHPRRLYLARFVFAAAWAGAFLGVGHRIDAASVTLLVLYPAVDVAAAAVDLRNSRTAVLYANIAVSSLAALGLAAAAADDIPAVLRVWGAWAITAGAVQLVVALRRRALGGQWPMILAGGISVFAGASFLASSGSATSMTMVSGYALLGGLFFLASALRLHRAARPVRRDEVA